MQFFCLHQKGTVFATQVGGDFDDTEERGHIYYCASKEDLDRAKVEAYPGDTVKLTSDIVYYGDLVFNKPVNLETNDFTLTVNGNLMYDYVLGNSLKLDAGGLGRIVVQCTKEGVGGNLKIKAPLSDVTLTGSDASIGDIVVEKMISVDATNAYGSAGVAFNNIRIVDEKNSRKSILLRQAITRYMKREGQIWIRIFPDKPITKKPAEVRMGKGKGNPGDS